MFIPERLLLAVCQHLQERGGQVEGIDRHAAHCLAHPLAQPVVSIRVAARPVGQPHQAVGRIVGVGVGPF